MGTEDKRELFLPSGFTRAMIVGRVHPEDSYKNGKFDTSTTIGYSVMYFQKRSGEYVLDNHTLEDVIQLVQMGLIENASLTNEGKLEMQGFSEKLLPSTTPSNRLFNRNPTADSKFFIVDKIVSESKKGSEASKKTTRFRIFNFRAMYVVQDSYVLDHLFASGNFTCINGKVVTREGKKYVSAKKGNFNEVLINKNPAEHKKAILKVENVPSEPVDVSLDKKQEEEWTVEYNHTAYRKKAVNYFLKQFKVAGRIKKIRLASNVKKAKVALNEYFIKRYPELKQLKGIENNLILECAVILELSKGVRVGWEVIRYSTLDMQIIDLGGTQYDKALKFLEENKRHKVSKDLIDYLKLRNHLVSIAPTLMSDLKAGNIDEELYKNTINQISELESRYRNDGKVTEYLCYLTRSFRKGLVPLYKKAGGGKQKALLEASKVKVSDIDFTTPDGFHKMGYSLLSEGKEKQEYQTIYGYSTLRPMFHLGVKGLKMSIPVSLQKDIVANVRTFGDSEIVRSLFVLKNALDKGKVAKEIVTDVINVRLAVLARYNLPLAQIMNTYLGEVATFSLADVNNFDKKDASSNEELYYLSGLKFSNPDAVVGTGVSWSGAVNKVPESFVTLFDKIGLNKVYNVRGSHEDKPVYEFNHYSSILRYLK